MKKISYLTAIFLLCTFYCFAQTQPEILTNKSIVDLTKAGLSKEVIVSQVEANASKFDVTTVGIIALKKAGVTDAVINAMINKANPNETNVVLKESAKEAGKVPVKNGVPAIELMNHVYFYNKAKQTVTALEKSIAGIRTKQGFLSGSAMLQIDGAASAIRLTPGEANSFVINTGGAALPELVLYRLKSVKGKREVASMKVGTFTGVKTGEDVVTIDVIKISEGIYQVSPNKSLEKGEYFFTGKPQANATTTDAFAFGVD